MTRVAPLSVPLGLMGGLLCLAQSNATTAARAEFEVASIKPHTSEDRRRFFSISPGGRFNATGVTLRMLLNFAYRVQDYQISGGPSWIESDGYDIVAKTEDGSGSKILEGIQSLLEDRFKLSFHRETRSLPEYALVVAKGAPKLLESEGDCPPRAAGPPAPPASTPGKIPTAPCGGLFMRQSQLSGQKIHLSDVVMLLSRILGRPVIDQTGLTGTYDIKLEWTPDQSQAQFVPPDPGTPQPPLADLPAPSIYTAVQEQLGLKLESQKGAVDVLIIDHVEKPSEN